MSRHRYEDIEFDGSFLFAERGKDEQLKFTRHERALLQLFTGNANKLLRREQILDAISHTGSDISDRNVDFLVNRLRTKLGDSARTPRFIATQYGEGYVWIAKPDAGATEAFLVIGPCYGLGDAATAALVEPVLSLLLRALDTATGSKHHIILKSDWRHGVNPADAVSYGVEASLHADGDRLHAAFVLRTAKSGAVLKGFRSSFARDGLSGPVEALAAEVRDAIWADLAMPAAPVAAPSDTPLELRLHDAARMLTRTPESWQESTARLEAAQAGAQNDPSLAIMRGLALYARLLQRTDSDRSTSEEWRETEADIESLVLGCLPEIQDNPLLVLGAAKLLFFIQRGHFELAERLADEAFEKSTAFAAAFSTRAQMKMCKGEFAEALSLYDKALELSEPASEFRIYLMILKLSMFMAASDRASIDAICAELYAIDPMLRMKLGLHVADAGAATLAPELEAMLAMLDEEQARRVITYLYNVVGRHFHIREHRENVMRGLLKHMHRRFGPGIVPDEVAAGLGKQVSLPPATPARSESV
jgi:tetratricopeptide (TPR) repeat protein